MHHAILTTCYGQFIIVCIQIVPKHNPTEILNLKINIHCMVYIMQHWLLQVKTFHLYEVYVQTDKYV